jgi:hypothetical protein
MIYDDLVAVHDQLNGPLEKMGNLYQQANDQISAAVAVDAAGAVNVDQAALRAAISEVVPPGSAGQYELLTDGLQMGFAVNSGGQRMLPWHALTNPDIVQHLDVGAWQALGFLPSAFPAAAPAGGPAGIIPAEVRVAGGAQGAGAIAAPLAVPMGLQGILRRKTAPLAGLNPPAAVSAPDNIAMLAQAASAAVTLPAIATPAVLENSQAASIWTLSPANMAMVVVRSPQPAAPAGSLGSTSTGQALTVDDLKSAEACFSTLNAGWDNPFVLRVCFDAACAKAVAGIFSLGLPVLLNAAVTFVTAGLTAALGAAFGWVGLAIIVSALYWAGWIAVMSRGFTKGVCMHIPMPWSFGVVGPGWCTTII